MRSKISSRFNILRKRKKLNAEKYVSPVARRNVQNACIVVTICQNPVEIKIPSRNRSSEVSANESESGEYLNKRYKWISCSNCTNRAKCRACKKRVDECPQCHTAFEEEDEPESDEDSSSEEVSEESSSDEEPQRKRKK